MKTKMLERVVLFLTCLVHTGIWNHFTSAPSCVFLPGLGVLSFSLSRAHVKLPSKHRKHLFCHLRPLYYFFIWQQRKEECENLPGEKAVQFMWAALRGRPLGQTVSGEKYWATKRDSLWGGQAERWALDFTPSFWNLSMIDILRRTTFCC